MKTETDPMEMLANPGKILANPGKVLANPGKVLANPGKVLANPGKVLANPGKVMANPGKTPSRPLETPNVKQVDLKLVRNVVNMCERRYIEILIVISTTCFALLSHVLNGRSVPPQLQPRHTAMTFNQLVLYDCLLHNISFMHALIQVIIIVVLTTRILDT